MIAEVMWVAPDGSVLNDRIEDVLSCQMFSDRRALVVCTNGDGYEYAQVSRIIRRAGSAEPVDFTTGVGPS